MCECVRKRVCFVFACVSVCVTDNQFVLHQAVSAVNFIVIFFLSEAAASFPPVTSFLPTPVTPIRIGISIGIYVYTRREGCREKKSGLLQTSQELRMLSSVTLNCQITKIVMNSVSQLSEF